MDLLLIRHGQSVANVSGLLISTDQDGLTDVGREQVDKLAVTLSRFNITPTLIFSSPWQRALQTTELLFGDDNPILLDPRLAETHPGIYGTWLEKDFYETYPDFGKNIANKYEGGESHLEMTNRAGEWVRKEVLSRTAENGVLAAVTHGGPTSAILQHLLQIPILEYYPSFAVPNASFTYLKWRADLGRFCIERVGQT
jgi:broad specificity phosphatase PhoE